MDFESQEIIFLLRHVNSKREITFLCLQIAEDEKMIVKKVLEYSREDTPIQDENLWKEIEECSIS